MEADPNTLPPNAACVAHPDVPASFMCAGCRRPFCDACVAPLMGSHYCGACRPAAVGNVQRTGRSGPARPVDAARAVRWMRIGCAVMAFLSVALLAVPGLLTAFISASEEMSEEDLGVIGFMFAVYGGMALIGLLTFGGAAVAIGPGRRLGYYWAWTAAVAACLCGSQCLLPIAGGVMMIIYLLKPEMKEYFGVW